MREYMRLNAPYHQFADFVIKTIVSASINWVLLASSPTKQRRWHSLLLHNMSIYCLLLEVIIIQDMSWSLHVKKNSQEGQTVCLPQMSQMSQRLRLSPRVLRKFTTCTTESVLSRGITIWMGSCTKADLKALKRVVHIAKWAIGITLSNLQDIYFKRCRSKAEKILKQPNHPGHSLLSWGKKKTFPN